jgi:hypothetical protein
MKPFTVIFYIDGDRAMETFVEKVEATDASDAWDKAIAAAKDSGGTSSGYSLGSWEWENATEIITLDGHHDASKDYAFRRAASA